MKRPTLKPGTAVSLKVSLLATLGVYMVLGSSHWASPNMTPDQLSLSSTSAVLEGSGSVSDTSAPPQEVAEADELLQVNGELPRTARANEIATINELLLLQGPPGQERSGATNPEQPELSASSSSANPEVVRFCDRNFSAKKENDVFVFTELMEADCDNCASTHYTVEHAQALTIAQVAEEVLAEQICGDENIAAAAEENEQEEELSAWLQCAEGEDDLSQLHCYAETLTDRRGRTFIEDVLEELGEKPTPLQFTNAVKARMGDVTSLLNTLIKSDDEALVSQIQSMSEEIAKGLDTIFRSSQFRNLASNGTGSPQLIASQIDYANRTAMSLVADFQSWGRRGAFRAQELSVAPMTQALSEQSEALRRQLITLNPESMKLVRGFITGYMNALNNPRYYQDIFYRSQIEAGFHTQLQMLSNLDPSAAQLSHQWQALAQQSAQLRVDQAQPLQALLHAETNPSARASMYSTYTSILQGISNSVDLTRADLYDPYFMSFDLLNMRTTTTAGRTENVQFHTMPVELGGETISTLPGNSQDISGLLNARTGTGAPSPELPAPSRGGRISY